MKSVVINRCFGGFGLSYKASLRYAELAGCKLYAFVTGRDKKGNYDFNCNCMEPYSEEIGGDVLMSIHYFIEETPTNKSSWSDHNIARNDSILVQVVQELGESANGKCAELHVVKIPDDVEYEIDEYDGLETIHEVHRSWS